MVDSCVGTPHLYQQLQPKLPIIVILAVVVHLRCCRPLCWGRLAGGTITLRRTLDNSDINRHNNSNQTPSKLCVAVSFSSHHRCILLSSLRRPLLSTVPMPVAAVNRDARQGGTDTILAVRHGGGRTKLCTAYLAKRVVRLPLSFGGPLRCPPTLPPLQSSNAAPSSLSL